MQFKDQSLLSDSLSRDRCYVTCSSNRNHLCTGTELKRCRDIAINSGRNGGKFVCLFCSDLSAYNSGYKGFFGSIDTSAKSYVMGWIASAGSIGDEGVAITVRKEDWSILEHIGNLVQAKQKIAIKGDAVTLFMHSAEMVSDIRKSLQCDGIHVKIPKPSVDSPKLADKLTWAFIRGLFDACGSIVEKSLIGQMPDPILFISVTQGVKDGLREFCDIPCREEMGDIIYKGYSALDFASKMYDELSTDDGSLYLLRNYDKYIEIIEGRRSNFPLFKCFRMDNDAVLPTKARMSDAGADVTVIRLFKTVGNVEFYDTGLVIQPEFGYYFEMVPRSSISKTGYILANSVGIIDATYRGNLIVALMKIDPDADRLKLPCKIAQIIPRRNIHMKIAEVGSIDDLQSTSRGCGGFGSTDEPRTDIDPSANSMAPARRRASSSAPDHQSRERSERNWDNGLNRSYYINRC